MRILISGGGTGGHVYPALALARYALSADSSTDILFVGTDRGLESRIVPQAGFPLVTITVRGYQRRLRQVGQVLREFQGGFSQAWRIIREFKPNVVLGTGGYVAAPVVAAAVLMLRPTVIHEQNALPGMANRYLAPLVCRVCLSFEQSRRGFSRLSRTVFTGNPRASEVAAIGRAEGCRQLGLNPELKTVVVYGGSRGALKVNQVITDYLQAGWLLPETQLVYVTGDDYYKQVMDKLGEPPKNVHLYPYLDRMPAALAAADLVITRSGATTLAEITALGLPAILVPSPNVANNHQYYNARLLSDAGAALLIGETEFNHYRLRRELARLRSEPAIMENMARSSKRLGVIDAAERVFRCLLEIARAV